MKFSEQSLRARVNPKISTDELAAHLTMIGLEVEQISPVANTFTGVVVGHVLETAPHPNADKLTLCKVDAGTGSILDIVCGAKNVRKQLKVAVAMIGAKLSDTFEIKASKLRGEPSFGMLCSLQELGLAEESQGILELPDDAPVGLDIREYLKLDDNSIELSLTPNRADCFSTLGIARELAALCDMPMIDSPVKSLTPSHDLVPEVSITVDDDCTRYAGRIIKDIKKDVKSPLWLVEYLRRSGLRSIHPVVDITNYVMLELGQPMHAFDLNKINGKISVRYSLENERIRLLNQQEIVLKAGSLVIADEVQALALAGIMGGEESAVTDNTTDILLESAWFKPDAIANARHYHLTTDSSQRFERGVDTSIQVKALELASSLIIDILGGQAGPVIDVVNNQHTKTRNAIHFDSYMVEKLTGLSLSTSVMIGILKRLGMVCEPVDDRYFMVTPPLWRFDMEISQDLVEEIIRIHGYDHLPAVKHQGVLRCGEIDKVEAMSMDMAKWLCAHAYHECISYSFIDPQIQSMIEPEKETLTLLNPISSELSVMRTGLFAGLLASMMYNVHRQQSHLRLFERGVVFDVSKQTLTERNKLAMLLTGERAAHDWSSATRAYDFYDLKGDVDALLKGMHINQVEYVPMMHPALHPGQSAGIELNGVLIGMIGALHPKLMDALDAAHPVFLAEICLSDLPSPQKAQFKPISRYPAIRRDLSFLVDKSIPAKEIQKAVINADAFGYIQSVDVFDVYAGKGIPDGQTSMAISLLLRSNDKTLVDDEINSLMSAIINALNHQFAIHLRE